MTKPNPTNPNTPFTARHPGTCHTCHNPYPTGTTIRKRNHHYHHANCTKHPPTP